MKARTIRIEFNKENDWWQAQCYDGIELEDAIRMIREAWADHEAPLIKDEKIRKAVRAFSEAIQEKKHILVIKECGRGRAEFSNGANYWIRLPLDVETMDALEDRTYYTIAELCGEPVERDFEETRPTGGEE